MFIFFFCFVVINVSFLFSFFFFRGLIVVAAGLLAWPAAELKREAIWCSVMILCVSMMRCTGGVFSTSDLCFFHSYYALSPNSSAR